MGMPVTPSEGKPGVCWVHMTTDIAASFSALLQGELDVRSYLRSLRNCRVEAVFAPEDPLPGFAEIFLIPYWVWRRKFLRV